MNRLFTEDESYQEYRSTKRRPIGYLELTAPLQGSVLDVSSRGLCVRTSEPLYVGSRRTFTVSDAMGREQKLAGYVRWSRRDRTAENGDGPAYVCGIHRCLSVGDPATI